ncbi:hypothetical protein ACIQVR_37010 [Streptomyces xanthochromogenes]|uniref:hypothetical protein n=1 Tax=Streptomyces xanthochromogenes TaxID=67384 RepID=UPI00382ABFE0
MDERSEAERRLAARGVTIRGDEWPDLARPEHDGYAKVKDPGDGSLVVWLLVRPGIDPYERRAFAEWAESRIDRFFEHGPDPDGWQWVEADHSWQMWVRGVELPEI